MRQAGVAQENAFSGPHHLERPVIQSHRNQKLETEVVAVDATTKDKKCLLK
jgi:hypothetical protein